ncbi:uncharacterized protein LOC119661788 [Hermetia illucens]|uniref:uncharacterized protein LOC119661788 n=1 Tax=Hermetia illucens TaxID=343691 RepID=UPI0018CC6D8B|nr:uncharacterized protein LOC119661788 [Hermetia illucens]
MELDKESLIFLIQKYKDHKLLWDRDHKWYFNKTKKNNAWKAIADSIGITAEDAKKKISSLLGSFRREKSKGFKSIGTGGGASKVYKSDWFAFKSFDFLLNNDNVLETPKSERIKERVTKAQIADVDTEISIAHEQSAEKTCASSSSFEEIERTFAKPQPPRKKLKRTHKIDNQGDPLVEMAYTVLQQSLEPEDATKKYTDYLAAKLNQFDSMTKSILIHKINNLIFEAEMRKYSGSTSSSGFSPSSTPTLNPSPSISLLANDTQQTGLNKL